jgi:hypothetical protein
MHCRMHCRMHCTCTHPMHTSHAHISSTHPIHASHHASDPSSDPAPGRASDPLQSGHVPQTVCRGRGGCVHASWAGPPLSPRGRSRCIPQNSRGPSSWSERDAISTRPPDPSTPSGSQHTLWIPTQPLNLDTSSGSQHTLWIPAHPLDPSTPSGSQHALWIPTQPLDLNIVAADVPTMSRPFQLMCPPRPVRSSCGYTRRFMEHGRRVNRQTNYCDQVTRRDPRRDPQGSAAPGSAIGVRYL